MILARSILSLIAISSLAHADPRLNSVHPDNLTTTITQVSSGPSGAGDFNSDKMSFSDDGRYVVFESEASNLVAGDTNGLSDIFLYDSQSATLTMISVGLSGAPANGQSFDAKISGDGNWIVFSSFASNLVSGDTNSTSDVFLANRSTGAITRVSVDSSGTEANGSSGEPSISHDGSLVTFTSDATDLVIGDTNGAQDVFLKNISTGATTLVSVSTAGIQGDKDSYQSKISWDGSKVVFVSDADNLSSSDTNSCSDIFSRNISASTTSLVSTSSSGVAGDLSSFHPDISKDGNIIVFESMAGNLIASDTNGYNDIFSKNMTTGATSLVSQTNSGLQLFNDSAKPSVSLDGRFVVFETISPADFQGFDTNNVSDTYIHDMQSGRTEPYSVSQNGFHIGDGPSFGAAISGDGSKFGFVSVAANFFSLRLKANLTTILPHQIFMRANPLVGQVVNVSAIGNLTEDGGTQDAFTFTRFGDTTNALTISYSIGGTATPDTDYTALPGTVTIPAGQTSVTVPVTVINSTLVKPPETITLSLYDTSSYAVGSQALATVSIIDSNQFTVTITATSKIAYKDGITQGNFRISRTIGGTYGDLLVNLAISGTAVAGANYVGLPSSVVIPNGQTYVDLPVIGIEDHIADGDLSIIATVEPGTGYVVGSPSSDTVTLVDDDIYTVTIATVNPVLNKSNLSQTGSFRIDRGTITSQALTVNYTLRGTATNGVDYQTLSGSATIPAGSQYVDVTVTAIATSTITGYQSIIIDLLPGGLYSLGVSQEATLTVEQDSNLPVVSVVTTSPNVTEDGTTSGTVQISRTGGTSSSLDVNYQMGGSAVNGVDYSFLSGTATIPAGQTSTTITITGIPTGMVEPTKTIILAIQSNSIYLIDDVSSQAQVNLLNNNTPTLQIFPLQPYASRNQTSVGILEINRTGDLSSAITASFTLSGTAAVGTDYTDPGTSIVIPAGASSAYVNIAAIQNHSVNGNRSVIATISSGSYNIGSSASAQIKIVDGPTNVFADLLSLAPNADISSVSISDNGRYVAFASEASNIVSGDTNGVSDIFVVDTISKTKIRIMATGGAEPNAESRSPMISADGNFVVFSSRATNFVDRSDNEDIYMWKRATGEITYVSHGIGNDSLGGDSGHPFVSSHGDFVVFDSTATNLVRGSTNNLSNIFLFATATGQLTQVNLNPDGSQFTAPSFRPSVSSDGNQIVFESTQAVNGDSDTYSDIILANRQANTLTRVSAPATGTANNGPSTRARISQLGNSVVYESASSMIVSNGLDRSSNIFKYNIATGVNQPVSISNAGKMGDKPSEFPSVDSQGDGVLFVSSARNLDGGFNCTTSGYIRSTQRNSIVQVQIAPPSSCSPPTKEAYISSSGQFVASVVVANGSFSEIAITSNPLN